LLAAAVALCAVKIIKNALNGFERGAHLLQNCILLQLVNRQELC